MNHKRTVIIVEDDRLVANWLGRRLENEGYEVKRALNGVDALLLAKSRKPDVLVTDLIMPVMSGAELVHNMKLDSELASIPIVVFTIDGSVDSSTHMKEIGADAYLVKSENTGEELVGVLNGLLSDAPAPVSLCELGTVLVVEHSALVGKIVANMVRACGVQAVERATALQEAMDILMTTRVDILSTSTQLADADAAELVKAVRGLSKLADLKLLVVSVTAEEDLDPALAAAGYQGYLRKPFTLPDLRTALEQLVLKPVTPPPTVT